NLVVQHFPSEDYLDRVLRSFVRLTAPGGAIFLGGVRHLGLLSHFHAGVQAHQAEPGASRDALRERVHRAVSQEKELVIEPRWLTRFMRSQPEVTSAAAYLKGGPHPKEITAFD